MKLKLTVAVLATAAFALATAPAHAQSKKGGKSKVTVEKSSGGYWASNHNACARWGSQAWYPIAAIGAIGCSIVYAVPVMVEGFVAPRSSKA